VQGNNALGDFMEFFAKQFCELTTSELYEILKSRSQIFMLEQNIICQDMDDVDYEALHCYIIENGRVTAYLRAFYGDKSKSCVKIGRVLTLNHGKGFGKILISKSLDVIKEKMPCEKVALNSQKQATGFYLKSGFKVVSDEFSEEGIPHLKMELNLL